MTFVGRGCLASAEPSLQNTLDVHKVSGDSTGLHLLRIPGLVGEKSAIMFARVGPAVDHSRRAGFWGAAIVVEGAPTPEVGFDAAIEGLNSIYEAVEAHAVSEESRMVNFDAGRELLARVNDVTNRSQPFELLSSGDLIKIDLTPNWKTQTSLADVMIILARHPDFEPAHGHGVMISDVSQGRADGQIVEDILDSWFDDILNGQDERIYELHTELGQQTQRISQIEEEFANSQQALRELAEDRNRFADRIEQLNHELSAVIKQRDEAHYIIDRLQRSGTGGGGSIGRSGPFRSLGGGGLIGLLPASVLSFGMLAAAIVVSGWSPFGKATIAIPGPIDPTPPPEPTPKPYPDDPKPKPAPVPPAPEITPEKVLDSTLNAFGDNSEMRIKEVQDFLKDREFMANWVSSNKIFGPKTTRSARAFAKSAFDNWPTAEGLSAYKEEFEKRLGQDLRSETNRTAPELVPQYWLLKDYISQNEAFFEAVRGDANKVAAQSPNRQQETPAASKDTEPGNTPGGDDKLNGANVTAWDKAREGNTIPDYNAYLDQFPDGMYAQQARDKIIDLEAAKDVAAWETALRQDTIGAYDYYKATNPNGRYRVNADIKIKELTAQNSGANDDQAEANSASPTQGSELNVLQIQNSNGREDSTDNTTNTAVVEDDSSGGESVEGKEGSGE